MKWSENLSKNLRLLRAFNGLSAHELSEHLKLPFNRIQDIENQKNVHIREHEIDGICNFFCVPKDDMLYKTATIIFK